MSNGYVRRRALIGFTLIETMAVIVILAIAAVAIGNLSGNIFTGQAVNKDVVVGTQLLQECAEQILAIPRSGLSINNVKSDSCTVAPGFVTPTINLYCDGGSNKQSTGPAGSPATCADCSMTCEVEIAAGNMAPIKILKLYRY